MSASPVATSGSDAVMPTLSVAAAVLIDWDAVVIGAGPAGSAVAIGLARRGLRVLLLDRGSMPRPKVCGCCLSPLAIAELTTLCPPGRLPSWLPLKTVQLVAGGRRARIPMPRGGVLSRESLDSALVREAIAAGADWLPQTLAEAIHEPEPEPRSRLSVIARCVSTQQQQQQARFQATVTVVAAGLTDTVRIVPPGGREAPPDAARDRRVAAGSRIGVGTTLAAADVARFCPAGELPSQELVMAVAREGYCGVVRLEDGRLDIAAAVDRPLLARAGGTAAAIAMILRAAGGQRPGHRSLRNLADAVDRARLRATPPLTHASPPVLGATKRIFRVGDAAGYVEPFTGEGIGWALAGGRILAESLAAAFQGGPPDTAAASYSLRHRLTFAGRHARCRRIARGVRSPTVVAGSIGLATALPRAAAWALPLATGASDPA